MGVMGKHTPILEIGAHRFALFQTTKNKSRCKTSQFILVIFQVTYMPIVLNFVATSVRYKASDAHRVRHSFWPKSYKPETRKQNPKWADFRIRHK